MAPSCCNSVVLWLLLFLLCSCPFLSKLSSAHDEEHRPPQYKKHPKSSSINPPLIIIPSNYSLSFSLTSVPLSPVHHHHHHPSSQTTIFPAAAASSSSLLVVSTTSNKNNNPITKKINTPSSYHYRSSFKYSMALVISLPIGTPPQPQQMVLDTGSQLSWIQCHKKAPPPTASFDPSLSSSFSIIPCNHPLCKPRIPDFTLPTSCDQNRLCHYSYFYADGTLAEGNLVREKFTFSTSQFTPPLTLGCAQESRDAKGILGMNLGRLSFTSQANVQSFSYCVPVHRRYHQGGVGVGVSVSPTGSFYLGRNPNSAGFKYVNLLSSGRNQRSPNYDPLAYTVGLEGIRIGGTKLNISASVFRADASGSGQTMIDSGTEYTFLVDEAYNKVRQEIVRLVGRKLKKGYVYGGALDMCFDGGANAEVVRMGIERSIGDMVLEFEEGVEIVVEKERILADVGGGVHCLGIGRSDMLGVASNIIGNFHQQNLWVEFDVLNRRVGFGKADCSRSVL